MNSEKGFLSDKLLLFRLLPLSWEVLLAEIKINDKNIMLINFNLMDTEHTIRCHKVMDGEPSIHLTVCESFSDTECYTFLLHF